MRNYAQIGENYYLANIITKFFVRLNFLLEIKIKFAIFLVTLNSPLLYCIIILTNIGKQTCL